MLKIQGKKEKIKIIAISKGKHQRNQVKSVENCVARAQSIVTLQPNALRNKSLSRIDMTLREGFNINLNFYEPVHRVHKKKLKLQFRKKRTISNCAFGIGFKIPPQSHQNEAGNLNKHQHLFPKRSITLITKLAFKNRNTQLLIQKNKQRMLGGNFKKQKENECKGRYLSSDQHLRICTASTLQKQDENKNSKLTLRMQKKSNGKRNQIRSENKSLMSLENHENVISPWDIF